MYEEESFSNRELAALVASKVYYHLGEYEEALTFALGAGKLFDTTLKTEYVDTIICKILLPFHALAKCIDKYISCKVQQFENPTAPVVSIDARLENVVQRMFDRCFADNEYQQV